MSLPHRTSLFKRVVLYFKFTKLYHHTSHLNMSGYIKENEDSFLSFFFVRLYEID